MVSITGQQRNCEAVKCRIEELVGLSTKRKHHNRSEVCAWNPLILYSVDAHVSVYCRVQNKIHNSFENDPFVVLFWDMC